MKGLIYVYTGDGKGKTTAAVELGICACGRGLRVLMLQFMKGKESGEIFALEKLEPLFEVKSTSLKRYPCQKKNRSVTAEDTLFMRKNCKK